MVRRGPQYSKLFFSKTACTIKFKFYVEVPCEGGAKICSQHMDYMTKMAATLKTLSKIFFGPISTKLGM